MFEEESAGLHSMIRQIFEKAKDASSKGRFSRPQVYGFTMGFTKSGEPVFEEFGDTGAYGGCGYAEPITDIIERHDSISVITELPGVSKTDIDLRVSQDSLSIRVDTMYRKYLKDIRLSTGVDPSSTTARFNNGILEVILARADDAPHGKRVAIK